MNERRALVLDDDRSWQGILTEILADEGLIVDTAGTLDEAMALLKSRPHRLAVVDLSLDPQDHRNQDGLQALAAVRRLDPGCAAILLSGFATVENTVSALTEFGAVTVQRKETFRRSAFRQVVRQALTSAPAATVAAQPAGRMAVPVQAEREASENALVVDDDAGWRSILSELLTDMGFSTRLCAGYGEALGLLRREEFDLALVDLSLSGSASEPGDGEDREGVRLLNSVRAQGIPAMVVSGVTDPAEIERLYDEMGVFAYIEKQAFDRRSFRRTVEEARSRRQHPAELAELTDREREVLELVGLGMTNKEIASKLVISTNTVKRHLKAIFAKLDIHTRAAAASKAKK